MFGSGVPSSRWLLSTASAHLLTPPCSPLHCQLLKDGAVLASLRPEPVHSLCSVTENWAGPRWEGEPFQNVQLEKVGQRKLTSGCSSLRNQEILIPDLSHGLQGSLELWESNPTLCGLVVWLWRKLPFHSLVSSLFGKTGILTTHASQGGGKAETLQIQVLLPSFLPPVFPGSLTQRLVHL